MKAYPIFSFIRAFTYFLLLYNIISWEKCNIFAAVFYGYTVKGMILPENG